LTACARLINHRRMPSHIARRCLVSGRVQGVYYRGAAQQRARSAGLVGHARNLPDGRVEVLVVGHEPTVREFIEWLWVGSGASQVTAVECEALEIDPQGHPRDFHTG
jgi:acylphosphatase